MKLNFGCGTDIKEGYVNADIQEGADLVFDFNKFPYPFKDNEFDYIYSRNVLEYLENPEKVLIELRRKANMILAKKARNIAIVHNFPLLGPDFLSGISGPSRTWNTGSLSSDSFVSS